MNNRNTYQDPLVSRYTDIEMQNIFSDNFKFKTWRKCWIALAEAQFELGLKQVTKEMVDELKNAAEEDINYEIVEEKEKEIRHDVMSHVYEFGLHCPKAKGIIHLGATSQYVGDNTDLIQIREGLKIIKKGLINTINSLAKFADDHKGLVTLGYTHSQPAQPTTIGKRFTLYILDLLMDLNQIEFVESILKARGEKGTVGTQASYLELFNGDYEKTKQLDLLISKKLGFKDSFPVSGQTYTRKFDTILSKALSGIGESANKFSADLRLMSTFKIMEEPFEANQTGSSAMAYKRNPMRCERMASLCRKLISLPIDFSHTHANQWFERTLDDSAIRRIIIPQLFLLTNAVLKLYQNIAEGMMVFEAQIKKYLKEELPFMATEAILMELVKRGKDRQEMHQIIKEHSFEAAKTVKFEGKPNDLFERLLNDKRLLLNKEFFDNLIENPGRFAGAAEIQTEEFLSKEVRPVLINYSDLIGKADSKVKV